MTAHIGTPLPRVALDDEGIVERAWLPSKSEPNRDPYEMARSLSGRWMHADRGCRGWIEYGRCYHIAALEGLEMTNQETQTEETRAITIQGANPLALMDDIDLNEIMSKDLVPVAEWTYSFETRAGKIEGVSVRGVQDAVRALATKGEAIRVVDVHMDLETPKEAFFVARAGRYAISPTGAEILTDTAIRGKRQPKYMKLRDGGEQFNEFWYEIGIAKAARNVMDAMLPEALRQWMKEQARTAPRNGAGAGRAPAPRTTPAERTERRAASQHRTGSATGTSAEPVGDPKSPREQAGAALWALAEACGGDTTSTAYLEAITPLQATYAKKLDGHGNFKLSEFTDMECGDLKAALDAATAAIRKAGA
jgi:hypothetical protein